MLLSQFLEKTQVPQNQVALAMGLCRGTIRGFIDSGATIDVDKKKKSAVVTTVGGKGYNIDFNDIPGPHRVL